MASSEAALFRNFINLTFLKKMRLHLFLGLNSIITNFILSPHKYSNYFVNPSFNY